MNDERRIIKTGLYSKMAFEILDSVLGQLSDGWGENNPRNDAWWRFAKVETEPDGQVVIGVSTARSERNGYSWNGRPMWTDNGFADMPDDDVLGKFAKWVKKTMQMELKDENVANGWKRDNYDFRTNYLSRDELITVADVYCVYEQLLHRLCGLGKYSPEVLHSVFGSVRTPEETAAEIRRRQAYDFAERTWLESKNAADEWEKTEIEKIRKAADERRAAAFKTYSEFKA